MAKRHEPADPKLIKKSEAAVKEIKKARKDISALKKSIEKDLILLKKVK